MTAGYSLLLYLDCSIYAIVTLFGGFVAGTMLLVQRMLSRERALHGEMPLH